MNLGFKCESYDSIPILSNRMIQTIHLSGNSHIGEVNVVVVVVVVIIIII